MSFLSNYESPGRHLQTHLQLVPVQGIIDTAEGTTPYRISNDS